MAKRCLDLLCEFLTIFADHDLYSSIVHADLSLVSFQFLCCCLGIFLAFADEELASGLIILRLCGYELDCLLVMFGELCYCFVYFLFSSVPLSFSSDDALGLQLVI